MATTASAVTDGTPARREPPRRPAAVAVVPGAPRSRAVRALARLLLAAVGGVVLYISFAPSRAWWAAIIGLALLGAAVTGLRGRSAFWVAAVFGAAFYLPLLSWTGVYVGAVPWLALAIAESLLVGPVGVLLVWARRLPAWPVWAAAAWVAGEALRARWPFGGFGWGAVAFSQPDGPLLPVAALLGAPGVALVVALLAFSVTVLLRSALARWGARATRLPLPPRSWLAPAVAAGAALVLGLLGPLVAVPASTVAQAPSTPIAVVQGNVPRAGLEFNAQRRAVLDNHAARTHELAAAVRAGTQPAPTLVVWPENSSDIDPYRNPDAAAVIASAADDIGVPILVGAVVQGPEPGRNYNMGIVWNPGTGPAETYTKRHPVPFAEYMPYRSFFRLFSDKVDLLRSEFLPGTRPGNFTVRGVPFGDLICFEIVEDDLTRDVVRGGAQLLVVQTNNATFGYTDETYQQQAMSRVRAVEFGREVLISATSGVSTVIRPDGSVAASVPLFTPGYLVPQVPLLTATTPATVIGPWVELLLTAATPLALLGGWLLLLRGRERDRRRDDRDPTGPLRSVGATSPSPAGAPAAVSDQEDPRP